MIRGVALIFVLSALLGWLIEPWWTIALVAFAVGSSSLILSTRKAWGAGTMGVGLLWLFLGAGHYWMGSEIMAAKVAVLLKLPSPILLVLATGFVGGLVGGLAAMSGHYFRQAVLGDEEDEEVRTKPLPVLVVRRVAVVFRRPGREDVVMVAGETSTSSEETEVGKKGGEDGEKEE